MKNKSVFENIVWSKELNLTVFSESEDSIFNENSKKRTTKIEKEIIWSTIVLYGLIIFCFFGLHIFGMYLPEEETTSYVEGQIQNQKAEKDRVEITSLESHEQK